MSPTTTVQNEELNQNPQVVQDDGVVGDNNDEYIPQQSSEELAYSMGLSMSIVQPALVGYRSVGIGIFGAVMRWAGMPLEKVALYMNSSQVSGKGQLAQAIKLTFREGIMAPYRVVGPASLTAWFMQYSVMGVAFQFFDQLLSQLFQVQPMPYGRELMEPPEGTSDPNDESVSYKARQGIKTILSPIFAACLESYVSNRAEGQRFFGPKQFATIEKQLNANALRRAAGPAFGANATRNVIMCQTSFLLTPLTYKWYFPQEQKSKTTLFWYGLGLNVFVGNVVAITQQALWGRSLDYLQLHGHISYRHVITQGLQKEGISAFFTVPKWFSRVLMNAPAQGTLPWFYNEILPLGEPTFMYAFKTFVHDPFLKTTTITDATTEQMKHQQQVIDNTVPTISPSHVMGRPSNIKRTRSLYGTLPTANPEFEETEQQQQIRRRNSSRIAVEKTGQLPPK